MAARKPPTLSTAVRALAQAALALPGVAAAETQGDYLYSYYHEGDIPAARSSSGNAAQRYDVQSQVFRLLAPDGERTYGVDFTYETMSGASPWYVQPSAGVGSAPVVVMSGASIRDKRYALDGSAALPLARGAVTLSAGISEEDDYSSISGGVAVERPDAQDLVTWSTGLSYSADRLDPTQGATETSTRGDDKSTASLFGGVSVVLDRRTVVQLGANYQHNEGYLSDPYKKVYVASLPNPLQEFDTRPDERNGWAATAKLRRHVPAADAALHADYRFYADDWDVQSNTLELAWHQHLGADWQLAPSARWYSQTAASFYAPYFATVPADGHMTSDYRLSPFGAITLRLDLDGTRDRAGFGVGVEYYEASGDYALQSVPDENPALLRYVSGHLRFSYRF
jgi:Protein of unknown function (DUF3570)